MNARDARGSLFSGGLVRLLHPSSPAILIHPRLVIYRWKSNLGTALRVGSKGAVRATGVAKGRS